MKSAGKFKLVLVTAPDQRTARRLARAVLEARLAACVNLVPGIRSLYWWRGEIEQAGEVLLLIKTTWKSLSALEKRIVGLHPYDTPEILVVDLRAGNPKYLGWLERNTAL